MLSRLSHVELVILPEPPPPPLGGVSRQWEILAFGCCISTKIQIRVNNAVRACIFYRWNNKADSLNKADTSFGCRRCPNALTRLGHFYFDNCYHCLITGDGGGNVLGCFGHSPLDVSEGTKENRHGELLRHAYVLVIYPKLPASKKMSGQKELGA